MRFGEYPCCALDATSRIAETPASEITISLPPSITAVPMASTTMIPICGAPVPIRWMIRSATDSPTTTPPTSCRARWRCAPCDAPRATIAAIEAKTGLRSEVTSAAMYQAIVAAAAVCTIASSRGDSRRRAVVSRAAGFIRLI